MPIEHTSIFLEAFTKCNRRHEKKMWVTNNSTVFYSGSIISTGAFTYMEHSLSETKTMLSHLHTNQYSKFKTKLFMGRIINRCNCPVWWSSNTTNATIRDTLKVNADVQSDTKNEPTPYPPNNCTVRAISLPSVTQSSSISYFWKGIWLYEEQNVHPQKLYICNG